jgi:hypothetical protein
MRTRLLAMAFTAAMLVLAMGATDALALKGCVKAPKFAIAEARHRAKVPVRVEPGLHSRVERKLAGGSEVTIMTIPRLRRVCPVHGFYPVVYEDRLNYEEVAGWIRGSELR